ncbi:eukaryotic polypeptide chain release factor 3 [Salpingoeca rosetta]|uniref:Eukaryotic polypeptide chain release factor 3 n=1 Tax=Salpingoeca rosetta (strain ATCC 50818 / BSB-021) TaxID=946362 RepID=F2UGA4_SALR5|nr:eukaryotic polypeptide chain release factor 3 [Salpingoeca rosetta]EGD75654.1 eukaryotic polypeptide chain release factor 3 [Salpingoeca rosetta]|eukprot:XP_004991575.1 eukaryotic polypeptide chain release factor 3 [Salpingoeca rosetta]
MGDWRRQQQQQQQGGNPNFNPNAAEFVPSFPQGGYQGQQYQGGYGYPQQPFYPNMYMNPYQQGYPQQGFPQQPYQQGMYNPYQQQPMMQPQQPQQQHGRGGGRGGRQPQQQQQQQQQQQRQPKQQQQQQQQQKAPAAKQADGSLPQTFKTLDLSGGKATKLDLTSGKKEEDKKEPEAKKEEEKKEPEQKEEEKKEAKAEETKASDDKKQEPAADDDDDDDDEDEEVEYEDEGGREHLNIVFIGHVDAGKSTIGGHIMYLTGMVDKRTMEKYEKEAKEANRESWYLSWALDTNAEERAKGKTVECGQAHFMTDKKYFTIIDAPGHKSFVPNMISGAAQADVGVLVISARKGEFETGFDRGGQTREHAMLAKTAGVKHLIIVINKMDDITVEWSEDRFNECRKKLMPFLKATGFKKDDLTFIPVSGLTGANLKDRADSSVCGWYSGPSLIEFLDELPPIPRLLKHPVRMPITEKYKDMGTVVMGKVQSGYIRKGQKLIMMPNKHKVTVDGITVDDEERDLCRSGDNVKLKLKNIEEEEIAKGHVLCQLKQPCSVCTVFDAQLVILEWKTIIAPGFKAVLHLHSAIEEVTLERLICHINKKTNRPDKEKGRPRFVKQGDVCIARLRVSQSVCVETFKDHPDMGRFTLRDEGQTLAIGKVLKLIE